MAALSARCRTVAVCRTDFGGTDTAGVHSLMCPESFAIPLKNATDTQWLFGLHSVQIRRMPLEDDETPKTTTDTKRFFDYYRYFPPQLFFSRAVAPQESASRNKLTFNRGTRVVRDHPCPYTFKFNCQRSVIAFATIQPNRYNHSAPF